MGIMKFITVSYFHFFISSIQCIYNCASSLANLSPDIDLYITFTNHCGTFWLFIKAINRNYINPWHWKLMQSFYCFLKKIYRHIYLFDAENELEFLSQITQVKLATMLKLKQNPKTLTVVLIREFWPNHFTARGSVSTKEWHFHSRCIWQSINKIKLCLAKGKCFVCRRTI